MAAPFVAKSFPRYVSIISCTCGQRSSSVMQYKPYYICATLFPVQGILKGFSRSSSDISQNELTTSTAAEKGKEISQAMKAYLQRAESYEKMMSYEIEEYEKGKRHLACMMGEDPETFSQEDIDKAIEYLLPSGLFEKKARPFLKHPEVALTKKKEALFSADGRPYHPLFYTSYPNFYQIMHEAGQKLTQLKEKEEKKPIVDGKNKMKVSLNKSVWMKQKVLEEMIQEKISENDYTRLLNLIKRLASQPYSEEEEEFIYKYRTMLHRDKLLETTKPVLYDENGKAYQVAHGKRKTALAKVTLYRHGTGKYTVNGKEPLEYFPGILERIQLMFPLQFVDLLGEVDVIAEVELGGHSGQAGAIRLATSRALQSFVEPFTMEKMRLAGLLTPDPRRRERKKFGQEGARRKFTWKKR